MITIAIRFQQKTEVGFAATLSVDGREYSIQIQKPFSQKDEHRLAWYFERWIHQPYTDTVKAEQVRQSIRDYGEALFQQVFKSDFDAYSDYRQLRGNLSQVTIEIIGDDPQFQALHWETLRDPELGEMPLAMSCVMVRRSNWRSAVPATLPQSSTLNVLLVTARPGEEKDLNYRTTSRPLMQAIENSRLPVNLVLLRPGTYEALERHLAAMPEGFYHIIHFDAHGGVMSYELLRALDRHDRVLLKGRYGGRSDLQPYEGKKAFLFLETEETGKSDPVETQELMNLLNGKRIPICILDACQLGQQVETGEEPEDSLGSRLMQAGMQWVVAMRYSVMADAAGMLMQRLYQELVSQKPLLEALRLGRRELFNQKSRKAYFNQQVELEDWLLPVIYCNQPNLQLELREMSPPEAEAYFLKLGSQYRFPQPSYGFVGRDLEILKIEKSLLRHNLLLVQGMGGTGKTTLLNYLREWWQRTNFVAQSFYFGYDQKAWTLEQLMFEIGRQVFDRFEQANFQAMAIPAQMMKLVAKLRSGCPETDRPYALILDNLESVTGQELAIPNTLPAAEQEKIRDFLSRLVGGKTYVVLGSRSEEQWLKESTFQEAVYGLKGLDPESRSALAEKILQRQASSKATQIRQDPDFMRLMQLLAGYPLAMEVVLANLRRQTASEILAAFNAAEIQLDADSEDKTKSIVKCVEYSHSNLSETAQKLLLCLAPFSGFIDRRDLPNYAQQLQSLEPFQAYDFTAFDSAIDEAIHWGLLSPMREDWPELLTIQPVFPYFLKTKLNDLDEATRNALQTGFKNHYQGLADSYQELMISQEAKKRKLGIQFCQWEYENLFQALQMCLDRQESINIFFCLKLYFDLVKDQKSNIELSEFVCRKLDHYPPIFLESAEGYQIPLAIGRLGRNYLEMQQYEAALKSYQQTLELYDQIVGVEEPQKQLWKAVSYHHLGSVYQALREYESARQHYQTALKIYAEYRSRYEQADTYHQLGNIAYQLREYESAQQHYQTALEIYNEYNDTYSQGCTYHQLGLIDQKLHEYESARRHYQTALEIYTEYDDRYSQLHTYHQLGRLDEELHEYESARRHYQTALEICIEYDDRYEQADTYHQLGMVDQALREYESARQHYQTALEIYTEYDDRYNQARTYHNLGNVAQVLREYELARQHYQTALEVCTEYGAQYEQAVTYQGLGAIDLGLHKYELARQHYQTALEIYIEFGDRYSQASTYFQLGKVAEALDELEEAKANYLKDLEITAEFNDEHNLGISLRNLARFYRVTQDAELVERLAQMAGKSVEEAEAILQQWAENAD